MTLSEWTTLSEFGTAFGTLVLAVATFGSVRSANRAARAAENALLEGLRPVLVGSRFQDPPEKVRFLDDEWIQIPGGCGVVEHRSGGIYLGLSLRNVGNGLAVLHAWDLIPELLHNAREHRRPEDFRRLSRDLYVAPGDTGFWQGAFRDPAESLLAELAAVVERRQGFTIDLLYGDVEGGQRVISRFALTPRAKEDGTTQWLISVSRHWNLDRADPR